MSFEGRERATNHFQLIIMQIVKQFASILSLVTLAYASSGIKPNGVPAGSPHPMSAPRNKTDFTTIFSSVRRKHHSRSADEVSARDASAATPPVPTFFSQTFGPINAANNAIGYMGFVTLPSYDTDLCAEFCNFRPFDASSGPCIYINIWTPVVNGTAQSPICSLYNTVSDASTATNTGQGDLVVTQSRGFTRSSFIADGSFQDYTCIVTSNNGCPFEPSEFWLRTFTVNYDFILVDNFPAHSGTSSALFFLDSAAVSSPPPDVPSTLAYTPNLATVAGQKYVLSFFYTPNSEFPVPSGSLLSVFWNGVNVLNVTQPPNVVQSQSLNFLNAQVNVVATGMDTLFFQNGNADPHQLYLDDIALFQVFS